MTKTLPATVVPSIPAGLATEDLAQAVTSALGRQRGEEVRCTHVYGDYYRCNWWVHGGTGNSEIRRSRFVRVTSTPDGLLIEDQTAS